MSTKVKYLFTLVLWLVQRSLPFDIKFRYDLQCSVLEENGRFCIFRKPLGVNVEFAFTVEGTMPINTVIRWFKEIPGISTYREMGTYRSPLPTNMRLSSDKTVLSLSPVHERDMAPTVFRAVDVFEGQNKHLLFQVRLTTAGYEKKTKVHYSSEDAEGIEWILMGTESYIPCISPFKIVELPMNERLRYIWTEGTKPLRSDGRFTLLGTGDLHIDDVHFKDSGNFSCEIKPISQRRYFPVPVFQVHNIKVYQLPKQSQILRIKYLIKECTNQILNKISVKIQNLILTEVCSNGRLCLLSNKTIHCDPKISGFSQSAWWNSVINLGPENAVLPSCVGTCKVKQIKVELDNIIRYVKNILYKHGNLTFPGDSFTYVPELTSLSYDFDSNCPLGFGFAKEYCVPCMPGNFGDERQHQCFPCPFNTYQSHIMADKCMPCTPDLATAGLQSTSQDDCVNFFFAFLLRNWILISALVVLLIFSPGKVIIIIYLILIFCFPNHPVTRKVQKIVQKMFPCFFKKKKRNREEYQLL